VAVRCSSACRAFVRIPLGAPGSVVAYWPSLMGMTREKLHGFESSKPPRVAKDGGLDRLVTFVYQATA